MHQLKPNQRLDEKPFTDVECSQQDLADLEMLRTALPAILAALPDNHGEQVGQLAGGRAYRVITTNRAALLNAPSLFVVGFCGTRVAHISDALLADMDVIDSDLVTELYRHPAIVCYASIQIEDGNWRNLVLMTDGDGVGHWRASIRHLYAAEVLSPSYYIWVRLHNGQLDQGLQQPAGIRLISTKYYDFQSPSEPWQAIREFPLIEQKTNNA